MTENLHQYKNLYIFILHSVLHIKSLKFSACFTLNSTPQFTRLISRAQRPYNYHIGQHRSGVQSYLYKILCLAIHSSIYTYRDLLCCSPNISNGNFKMIGFEGIFYPFKKYFPVLLEFMSICDSLLQNQSLCKT